MPSTTRRRPLPALIFLIALLAVTALVWWRVIGRHSDDTTAGSPCPSPTPTTSTASTAVVLPTPPSVTVVVLNATARAGIASRARDVLVSDGFAVPAQAANDKPGVRVRGVAEIRYGPGGLAAAKLLRYYLPSATLVPTTSADGSVVVSLGAKYRTVASRAAVQAAMRADGVVERDTPSPAPSADPSTSPSSSSC